MSLPSLSILIANYNNARFLGTCLQSLARQTCTDWEAVILDDGSTDDSVTVIRQLIQGDGRFKFFQNPRNMNAGYTKRRLVELSAGDVFAFLDPDDALEPHALELMRQHHAALPETGLIYSNFTYCDANLLPQSVHRARQVTALDSSYYNFQGEIAHFATFKRRFYAKTTGIDPFNRIAHDKDLYLKMCEVAPVKHVDEALYLYRLHSGGISTANNAERAAFWHWVALIKMAERRGVSIEQDFLAYYLPREKVTPLKQSRLLRLLHRLGFVRAYRHL